VALWISWRRRRRRRKWYNIGRSSQRWLSGVGTSLTSVEVPLAESRSFPCWCQFAEISLFLFLLLLKLKIQRCVEPRRDRRFCSDPRLVPGWLADGCSFAGRFGFDRRLVHCLLDMARSSTWKYQRPAMKRERHPQKVRHRLPQSTRSKLTFLLKLWQIVTERTKMPNEVHRLLEVLTPVSHWLHCLGDKGPICLDGQISL